jgi:hypothetical protein
MGCTESKEVDLRNDPSYDVKNMWVCDIEEKAGEGDNDFLFLANITGDGDAGTDVVGRCIFASVMYDVNRFVPDTTYDGKLNFEIMFGARTAERPNVVDGWSVSFLDLLGPHPETRRYSGMVKTSWWGERKVTLIPYGCMSDSEKSKYPDLIARYYKSKATPTKNRV